MSESGSKIKVEVLTERKIIDVVPGIFQYDPPRIYVNVCVKCGAVVFDFVKHDLWHRGSEGR